MAEVFRFNDLPKQSKKFIDEAKKNIDINNISIDILAYYYNRRAAIESMYFDKNNALKYSKKVLDLEDKIKNKEIVVYSYNEIAALNEFVFKKHDLKSCLEEYKQAFKLAHKYDVIDPQLDIIVNISRVSSQLNQLDTAINYLLKGEEIANKVGSEYHIYIYNQLLKGFYYQKKQFKKAFDSYDKAMIFERKLIHENLLAKTLEIEKKYNISIKENELKKKENEIILKNNELENNKKTTLLLSITFLITLLAVFTLVYYYSKINKYNKQLENLSNENEFLLSEANHRINNNLQLIIILISDQLKKMPLNEQVIINNILAKIESIATLHKHLYKSNDVSKIDLEKYFNEIVINLQEVFENNNIETNFLINKVSTSPDNAMYYGLLLTELCINSVKHAFTEDTKVKRIEFECFSNEENSIHFKYFDNGSNSKNQIIKPKLVDKICRNLKINYKIETENGFLFTFTKNN
jgi:two-component sensor histidine kinase